MQKTHVLLGILAGLTATAYGQGQIQLSNFGNTSTDTAATSNGLLWLSTGGTPVLINQDFNASFYGGTGSTSLTLLATFLLSNGTAAGDNSFGPGTFVDLTATPYTFPTLSPVFVQIQAWTGTFNSYAAAANAGAPVAQSRIFLNPVDAPPGAPVPLTGMPAMVLTGVPEPSTLALAGLGGLSLLMLRPRRRHANRAKRLA